MKDWKFWTFEERQRYVTACNQLLDEMREAYALYAWHEQVIKNGLEWAAQWCADHPQEPPSAYQRWLDRARS